MLEKKKTKVVVGKRGVIKPPDPAELFRVGKVGITGPQLLWWLSLLLVLLTLMHC